MSQKPIHNSHKTKDFRRRLRKKMTKTEIILWSQLKGKQLGYKFRRQHAIGPYIIDFYCMKTRLAIELDGNHHFTEEGLARDAVRDQYLEGFGIKVIRIENRVALDEMSVILQLIEDTCRERYPLFNQV